MIKPKCQTLNAHKFIVPSSENMSLHL